MNAAVKPALEKLAKKAAKSKKINFFTKLFAL